MKIEKLNKDECIERFINNYIPNYLYKEQKEKCIKTVNEVFLWTDNDIDYELDAFHEVILYYIIYKMENKSHYKNFIKKYFDKKANEMILEIAKIDQEYDLDYTLEDIKEFYYDITFYYDDIFSDLDFLDLVYFYNGKDLGDDSLIERMGVNMDYYFEILPMDIQKKYKTGHCTLTGEIWYLLRFLNDEIENRDFYKLFWDVESPASLSKIIVILDNMFLAYFHKQEIDIAWDMKVYKRRIEISFYKVREEEEKILVYFTLVNSKLLDENYLDTFSKCASKYHNAFFIFLAFTDADYDNVIKYLRKYVYTETIQSLLNVHMFDVRQKEAISKLKN